MHILSTLCGLLAGLILGALTAFFQLFGLAALELGAQRLLNSPLSPKQDLFLNLAVYAVLLYFVRCSVVTSQLQLSCSIVLSSLLCRCRAFG